MDCRETSLNFTIRSTKQRYVQWSKKDCEELEYYKTASEKQSTHLRNVKLVQNKKSKILTQRSTTSPCGLTDIDCVFLNTWYN